ncbi:MAG: hypothetical protein GY854_28300 [Deltaproteobacteria bacterium]|nr:hypothetical protein [Deltaproteobacteria bacterium]
MLFLLFCFALINDSLASEQDEIPGTHGPAKEPTAEEPTAEEPTAEKPASVDQVDATCSLPCYETYKCVEGECVSLCDTPCETGKVCTTYGKCVLIYGLGPPNENLIKTEKKEKEDDYEYQNEPFMEDWSDVVSDENHPDDEKSESDTTYWLGAHFGVGFAAGFGRTDSDENGEEIGGTSKVVASMGGWLDLHHYFSRHGAATLGLGLANKGARGGSDSEGSELRDIVLYLDIPIGLKGDFRGFSLGLQ